MDCDLYSFNKAKQKQGVMKPSALRSWKSFVAKIHPPLPLSPKESQKLLSFLVSSFRRHLDGIHPSVLARSKTTAEIHLQTVLAAPHFNNSHTRQVRGTQMRDSATKVGSLSQIRQLAKSPMGYFEKCVSAGTATPEIAAECLVYEFRKALSSPEVKLREALKLSGAGTTVLNWLRSPSREEGLSFLNNRLLLKFLIPFVLAERQESVIWQWMQELKTYSILRSRSEERKLAIQRIQYDILVLTFGFEIKYATGLSTAIETLAQTARNISSLAGTPTLVGLIGLFVVKLARSRPSTINGDSINLLVQIIDQWDRDPQYRRALVELYRPENPDIASALALLQQYPTRNIAADTKRRREELIFLGFRLAELLIRDGSYTAMSSANWVMNFLQDHFAEEIGSRSQAEIRQSERRERSKSQEASNIRLLDALSMG